ncbi:ATP-binding protein [Clostridium manihotivorum]|uniref:Cell division protein MukB n=1 Tax=Clostridium manihotivorum TaxID=2320868 RepID=A0A3R5VA17_9CLOT|nr:SbcC/MukB-like Walker B domain-containing protein [Clostridium manihotivorum]QAA33589.1 cell division protein MukB [Clostridium manihotivorum]
MKKLKRMRLINWHRFLNETIEINNSVLLSGENGAGKSTILDAIQLVLTCSKNNFNKAANENGKRTLAGYVRCKTGKESKPYEREGQVTAHIALEFYEAEKNRTFLVGAVIDSASETKEKTVWYRIENQGIKDELFLQGNKPKNIDLFRNTNKKVQTFNQTDAKKDFKNRFGRLEDKFFELVPKALAFKPIDDIKDFVYSYVLDKKEVNIEVLKENVRSYQELEKMLSIIKIKIQKLEAISECYDKIVNYEEREKVYDYIIKRSDVDISKENIARFEFSIKKLSDEIDALEAQRNQINNEISGKNDTKDKLEYELLHNEEYLAIKDLESKIYSLEPQIRELEKKKVSLMAALKESIKNTESLVAIEKDFPSAISYLNSARQVMQNFETSTVSSIMETFVKDKRYRSEEVSKKVYKHEAEKEDFDVRLSQVNKKITELEKKKLQYKPEITMLLEEIKKAFNKAGKASEPRILCELLRITDERWKNAVEGYLNTQRFYIIVEPEDFDLALNVYENLRKNRGLHSAGLINTSKLEGYDKSSNDTLASVVTSQSIWAKRFANMILGKVMLCEKVEELKLYKCSITPGCMLYQNHVARVIDPKVYKTPYIGEDAYKIQLEQALEEKSALEQQKRSVIDSLKELNKYKELLGRDRETEIKYNLEVLPRLKTNKEQLESLKVKKTELEKNNNFFQKQMVIEGLKKEIEKLDKEKENILSKKGSNDNQIKNEVKAKAFEEESLKRQEEELNNAEKALLEKLEKAQKEYEGIFVSKKTAKKIKEDYEGTKKRTETLRGDQEKALRDMQYRYKSEHDFGAEATYEGARLFLEELNKLKSSELLSYEEKVYEAKKGAELEFKEQFLSKLQENIKKAQGEFKQLNKALKDIKFGSESYEFKYSESKRFSKYYKMIMDDFNIVDGYSLLSGQFNDRHKEVIDELFEKLTLDEENSSKTLEEFTDYRTYMDYDIHINHGDGTESYYSKVAREKSGGETQTPFYVTIAASFVQLYSQGIGNESIGLILFDEAFDKMDDERTTGVLEFLNNLPLQMIIAAPPEKIQYIGPQVDSTLLALKEDNISYVEVYSYEKV